MTREELDNIVSVIKTTKEPKTITKRDLVEGLGCQKRTSHNCEYIDDYLESNVLKCDKDYKTGYIDEPITLSFKYPIKSDNFQLYFLHIKGKFKNLHNFKMNILNTNNYCCIIGINGSGKSNVLEAISAIFYSLYHIATLTNGIKKYPCEFSYTISYILNGEFYEITDGISYDGKKLTKEMLPKNIIASYSGEDKRLWERYYKPVYDKHCSKIIALQGFTPPFMLYIDRQEWEIALLTLLFSEDRDVVEFVRSIMHDKTCKIKLYYNTTNIRKWEGTEVEAFIEKLRENSEYNISTFRDTINEISFIDRPSTLFYYLYKCSTSVDSRVIRKVDIRFGGVSLEELSEGEKKMIIVNAIIHILSNNQSLCLFDEPDSHIHIGRKEELEKLFDTDNRYSIITTHSPTFLRKVSNQNIRSLSNGQLEDIDKLQQIKELSGGIINYFEGALLLNSCNPLILVEGIGDVNYIRKAIELLQSRHEGYSIISWDFLFMGGAGENAKQFIEKIGPHILEQRKVIVVFDRDESGSEAMKKLGFTGNREDYKTYKKGNWYYLMLPKTSEHNDVDFTIEDYFSIDYKKKIAKQKIDESGGIFKKIPKDLRQNVKDTLGNQIDQYTADDMEGFSVLIDKILDIVNEREIVEEKAK